MDGILNAALGIFNHAFFSFLIPVIALGVVVLVHELGHFLVARWCGIKVLKFSIGFGPKIFSWQRGETEYRVSWLFFGGYVKFLGDEPAKDETHQIPGAYYYASPFRRILVCLAGPMMNLVFGFLIYTALFWIGRPVVLDETPTVIGSVAQGSPAEEAGLRMGDEILRIDGVHVATWKDIINGIALSRQDEVSLTVMRDYETVEHKVLPLMDKEKGIRFIGISKMEVIKVDQVQKDSPAENAGLRANDRIVGFSGQPVAQWEALIEAVQGNGARETTLDVERDDASLQLRVTPKWDSESKRFTIGFQRKIEFEYEYINPFVAMAQDIQGIFYTLGALFAGTVSLKGLAGPVGIVTLMGTFAEAGFIYLLGILALISVNLGVFNLFPIPVLDGGHVMFNGIEMIFRRAIPLKVIVWIQNVFVAALLLLLFFVTYQDLLRLFMR